MNKDFIRNFFFKINKHLPELEHNINRDRIDRIKSIFLEMEMDLVLFKKRLFKEYDRAKSNRTV